MANGTVLISGLFPFQAIDSSANLKLRSYNMIKGSTDRHPLSHLDLMMKNPPQRSRTTRMKSSSASQESMELGQSSENQLPVMRLFQKFITSAGLLVECTHRGCKRVVEEDVSNTQLPHDWSSLEDIMGDIVRKEYAAFGRKLTVTKKGSEQFIEQTGEREAVEVVGMYASFLWATEEGHDK